MLKHAGGCPNDAQRYCTVVNQCNNCDLLWNDLQCYFKAINDPDSVSYQPLRMYYTVILYWMMNQI
jgi:hypothetical protein